MNASVTRLPAPKKMTRKSATVTRLRSEGYLLSPDYTGADVVIGGRCGDINFTRKTDSD